MEYKRRDFLQASLGALLTTLGGCATHERRPLRCPATLADFALENDLGPLPVYRCKEGSGAPIVLLHELPGMSPSNLALAKCLAREGFTVYLPLLFGEPGQERFFAGYFQSCAQADFECSALSVSSPIVSKLRVICAGLVERTRASIGIIGMCLTGAFPLALLADGVEAAVLCQPTLPFNALFMRPIGAQKRALGLDEEDIRRATSRRVPILAMRYASDALCPQERINALRQLFQKQLAVIEIADELQGHSTLADHLNEQALADAINYLKARLRVDRGAKRMQLAKLGDRPCEITTDGQWRELGHRT